MPTEDHPEVPKKNSPQALSPAKRSRLEKLKEAALQKVAGLKPDYEYAAELLSQCVLGDPGNHEFLKAYIENLHKKYNNNRSGAMLAHFKERAARNALKKALTEETWDEIIKQGVQVLKVNPWDLPTLTAMAAASKKLGHFENEMYYLKSALMGNPKDPTVNRLTAIALSERGQLDQAMVYWRRVEEALPDDEEPRRAIAHLQTLKMHQAGFGIEETKKSQKLPADEDQPEQELTIEKKLLQAIAENPKLLPPYFELAQHFIREEQYDKAEQILGQAYEKSNGDPDVREKWEDAQLRHFRQQVIKTEDPVKKNKLQQEYYQKELDFFKKRCERFPSNLIFRYDLGCRYMLTKQYNEAIRELQLSKTEPHRKGVSLLALGKCFQQIEQDRLALSHYEQAVE
ncbi:MAG TPA: hypothetical protein VIH42_07130, partial [Thermoguttaceae bacterium]